MFTREDISTLPVLETKFEGRECDYLGQASHSASDCLLTNCCVHLFHDLMVLGKKECL